MLLSRIGSLTTLQRLDVCHNMLGPEHAALLARALAPLTALRELKMGDNTFQDSLVVVVRQVVALPALQYVDVSQYCRNDEGTVAAVEALLATRTAQKLEGLYMSDDEAEF